MSCTAVGHDVTIVDQNTFSDLRDEWDRLLQRSYDNRLYSTSTWLHLWWKHFDGGEVKIVTARSDGDLIGVLPLQVKNGVLSLAGDHNVSDYMDGLALKRGAQDILTGLWRYALEAIEFSRIELRHVPSASPLIPALQQAGSERRETVITEHDEVCPVAILCSDWDGYLATLTKKQRHEIRRKLRRAQEKAPWTWRTAETMEDLDRDLPVFFELQEGSGHDKARFMTPRMRTYFSDVARTFLREGLLRLSIFQRENIDVAGTMSFYYRGRYLLYNSGYDPAHAAESPGIAAVALAMQDAIAMRAIAFDFLSGNEPYKYQFGASDTRTCRIELLPS